MNKMNSMHLFTALIMALSVCVRAQVSLVKLGYQCGGSGYSGPTVCEDGLDCAFQDATFSICLPKPTEVAGIGSPCGSLVNCVQGAICAESVCVAISSAPQYLSTTTSISRSSPVISTNTRPLVSVSPVSPTTIPHGGQCGGGRYTGSGTCEASTSCVYVNASMSVCAYPGETPNPPSPSYLIFSPTVSKAPPSPSPSRGPRPGAACDFMVNNNGFCGMDYVCGKINENRSFCMGYFALLQEKVNCVQFLGSTTCSYNEGYRCKYVSETSSLCEIYPAVPVGYQCGGAQYTGLTNCEDGSMCVVKDTTTSICMPKPINLAALGQQCGGNSYTGPTLCESGSICVYQNAGLSICQAPPSYSPSPIQSVVPLNNGSQCGGNGYAGSTTCNIEKGLRCEYVSEDLSICKPYDVARIGEPCGGASYTGSTVCESGLDCTYGGSFYVCSTPTPLGSPVPLGYQCGGIGYSGSVICEAGSKCVFQDVSFSICLPDSTSPSSTVPLGYQCGGVGYSGPVICEAGAKCVVQDVSFSICLPDSTSPSSTVPFLSSTAASSFSSVIPSVTTLRTSSTIQSPSPAPTTSPIITGSPRPRTVLSTMTKTLSSVKSSTLIITITTKGTSPMGKTTTKTTTKFSSSTASPKTSPRTSCSAKWGQCGGIGWTGPKCCVSGTSCSRFHDYYSQCL